LGGARHMDLALNGDLLGWNMDKLHQLRREYSAQLTRQTKGPRIPR
jgi:hypothetical protein